MQPLSSSFEQLIRLAPVQPDPPSTDAVLVGPPAPERFGRTYGGQFLAQALAAAAATVEGGKAPHSLHAYFLRGGDVDRPTSYRVEHIRDGRSFAQRAVTATQATGETETETEVEGEVEVFRLMASFHAPESGSEYHPSLEYDPVRLPPPDAVDIDYPGFATGHPDFDPDGWDGATRPMELRYINPPSAAGGAPVTEPQLMWVRVDDEFTAETAPEPARLAAALAYVADGALIDHALLPHGRRWFDHRLTGASLDHAMWFHRLNPAEWGRGTGSAGEGDYDGWLLYDQRVQWTGQARGLVTGRFHDPAGRLLATCTQEGLIRWRSED